MEAPSIRRVAQLATMLCARESVGWPSLLCGEGKGKRALSQTDLKRKKGEGKRALGLPALTNEVRGWGSRRFGRLPLSEVIALYRRKRVRIREPAILIRINELYRGGMNETELYDATRGIWKVGEERVKAKYAFAVFEGVIREVYEISQWLHAGSTLSSRNPRGLRSSDRWEFVGRLAPELLRRRYINRYVGQEFKQGNQNPIRYVNL